MKTVGRRQAPLALCAAAAVFIVALIVAAASLIYSMRSTALDDAQAQLDLYVSGAEASLNRTILNVDVLLASTVDAFKDKAESGRARASAAGSAALASSARLNLSVRL